MIKAIIFDFGGVLVRTLSRKSRRILEQKYRLSDWGSDALVFDSDLGQQAQLGFITDSEMWQGIGDRLGLSPEELEDFQDAFWAGDKLDHELIDIIVSLRPKFQTAIISNATDALRQNLETVYPITQAFDLIVCSAEEKVMKPDPIIYERTLERLERLPEEVIFIDDSKVNIDTARKLGMNVIHYRESINLLSELERSGVSGGNDGHFRS